MTTLRIILLHIISLSSFTTAALATDDDAPSVVERWLAVGTDVSTIRIEFTQTRKLKTIKLPIVKKGTLWIDYGKDRFRWQTGDPPKTIVVREREDLIIIRTPGKKFERRNLTDDEVDQPVQGLSAMAAGFPRSLEAFEKEYLLIEAQRDGERYRIITKPLGARGRGVEQFVFLIDAKHFQLQGFEIQLGDGSSIQTSFEKVEADLPLPGDLFAPGLTNYKETRF